MRHSEAESRALDQHEPSEVLEGLDAPAELESWFEASLAPRLARAVRLGLVDERQAVALEVDVRSLIGGERAPRG
jgi:hypothetical protein